jgi:hypothetical protein
MKVTIYIEDCFYVIFTGSSEGKKNNTSFDSNSLNFNSPPSADVNSMKCLPKEKQYTTGKQIPLPPSSSPPGSPLDATPSSSGGGSSGSKSIQVPNMTPGNPNPNRLPPSHNYGLGMVKEMFNQSPNATDPSSGSASPLANGSRLDSSSTSLTPLTPMSDLMTSSGPSSLPGLDSSLDVQMGLLGSACFKYSEIMQATNNFNDQKKIGEGAFGAVYFAMLRHIRCAVKRLFEVIFSFFLFLRCLFFWINCFCLKEHYVVERISFYCMVLMKFLIECVRLFLG